MTLAGENTHRGLLCELIRLGLVRTRGALLQIEEYSCCQETDTFTTRRWALRCSRAPSAISFNITTQGAPSSVSLEFFPSIRLRRMHQGKGGERESRCDNIARFRSFGRVSFDDTLRCCISHNLNCCGLFFEEVPTAEECTS